MSRKTIFNFLVASLALGGGCTRKSPPLSELREQNLSYDLLILNNQLPVFEEPLTLHDILEIALHQNLELKVKEQELAIKNEMAYGTSWKTLPQVIFTGEQAGRNQNTGSTSESLTNQPPAPPSISSTQNISRNDFTMTWNMLDFGLSYLRAEQDANKALMTELEYERIRQNLVLDVTKSYWKAILALNGVNRSQALIDKINHYQASLRKMTSDRVIPRSQGLRIEAEMAKLKLQLSDFHRDFVTAKTALAQAMGIRDSESFALASIEKRMPAKEDFDYEALQDMALSCRPELFSRDVEEIVFKEEIKIQTLSLLPPLAPYASSYHDGNRFLLYNNWLQAGLKVSYDLFSIPHTISNRKVAALQTELVRKNRIAMSLAVITQLNLALLIYQDARENYKIAHEFETIKKRLYEDARKIELAGELHKGELLSFETEAFLAEMTALEMYGNMKLAEEQINNSLGLPLYITEELSDVRAALF